MTYLYTDIDGDYQTVRRVIELISENWQDQPDLNSLANAVGKSPTQLQKLFTRWAGLSPKAFLQAVTLDHAKRLLTGDLPLLDASYELGLSGPGRLHDLFVTHVAMSPGAYKERIPAAAGLVHLAIEIHACQHQETVQGRVVEFHR